MRKEKFLFGACVCVAPPLRGASNSGLRVHVPDPSAEVPDSCGKLSNKQEKSKKTRKMRRREVNFYKEGRRLRFLEGRKRKRKKGKGESLESRSFEDNHRPDDHSLSASALSGDDALASVSTLLLTMNLSLKWSLPCSC